jgi:hypothetical protein
MRPDNWKEQIGGHEAISFGAVGWPEKIADHVSLWDRCCCFAVGWTSAVFHACWYKYKRLIFGSGKAQTAAIPGWYREDLQHRQGRKDAFLCAR